MQIQLHEHITLTVRQALEEDVGAGDLTARLIDASQQAEATIITRENVVICGIPWVNEVFRQVDSAIALNWLIAEGDIVSTNNTPLCEIQGLARGILTAERTALNFLQTLSGTATTVHAYAALIADLPCTILDTRKTIPGLRLAQKYAVCVGGGQNHRIGLYDGVLIKENHIRAAGSIVRAVQQAHDNHGQSILVEVEVESLNELEQALDAGARRIMLDNFSVADMTQAVSRNNGQAELEASGDITRDNLRQIALTGVDYISLGALTKHVRAIDLSMQFSYR